jgi:hypothetical protein
MLNATRLNNTTIPNDFRLSDYNPNFNSYSPYSSNTPLSQVNNQSDFNLDNQLTDGFGMSLSQPNTTLQQNNVDWTGYDFSGLGGMGSNNNADNIMLNDPSFFQNQTMPLASEQFGNLNLGMTPSSGDVTDIDELGFSRTDQPRSQSGDASTGVSSPENSQFDRYRLSAEGTPQMQNTMLSNNNSNNADTLDIDEYLRQAQAETKRLSIQNQMRQMMELQAALSQNNSQDSLALNPGQSPSLNPSQSQVISGADFKGTMHPFTVHEAQERAHSADVTPAPEFASIAMPATTLAMDPSWSAAPDMTNPTFTLDDAQEDEDWIR